METERAGLRAHLLRQGAGLGRRQLLVVEVRKHAAQYGVMLEENGNVQTIHVCCERVKLLAHKLTWRRTWTQSKRQQTKQPETYSGADSFQVSVEAERAAGHSHTG